MQFMEKRSFPLPSSNNVCNHLKQIGFKPVKHISNNANSQYKQRRQQGVANLTAAHKENAAENPFKA
jgi:hypothetical protein